MLLQRPTRGVRLRGEDVQVSFQGPFLHFIPKTMALKFNQLYIFLGGEINAVDAMRATTAICKNKTCSI